MKARDTEETALDELDDLDLEDELDGLDLEEQLEVLLNRADAEQRQQDKSKANALYERDEVG